MAAASSTGSVGFATLGLIIGLSGVGLVPSCIDDAPASSARDTRIGATCVAMMLVQCSKLDAGCDRLRSKGLQDK